MDSVRGEANHMTGKIKSESPPTSNALPLFSVNAWSDPCGENMKRKFYEKKKRNNYKVFIMFLKISVEFG